MGVIAIEDQDERIYPIRVSEALGDTRSAMSGPRDERETGASAALVVSATGVEQGASDQAPIACVDADELAGSRIWWFTSPPDHGDRDGQSGAASASPGCPGLARIIQ